MQVYVAFVEGRVSMHSPILTVILFNTGGALKYLDVLRTSWSRAAVVSE